VRQSATERDWLILADAYSDPSGNMKATWETTIQEDNPDGTPIIVNGRQSSALLVLSRSEVRDTFMCTACA